MLLVAGHKQPEFRHTPHCPSILLGVTIIVSRSVAMASVTSFVVVASFRSLNHEQKKNATKCHNKHHKMKNLCGQ